MPRRASACTRRALFDTELAGRLLGYPRVGLATLVETVLGDRMKKEHSAVDWSTRPLPEPWLEYAALDVEVLVELRDALAAELVEAGKDEWARQEFEAPARLRAAARVDAWRRTSGMHRVRGRRGLGAVRALWETRDELAERRDVTPGRIIPDSAIVAAAQAMPTDRDGAARDQGLPRPGRGAVRRPLGRRAPRGRRRSTRRTCPSRTPRTDGPPLPRAWAERDPVAARRLALAREAHRPTLAEEQNLPVENLLTPDYLRRVLWTPPETRDPERLPAEVVAALAEPRRPAVADRAGRAGHHRRDPRRGPPDAEPEPDADRSRADRARRARRARRRARRLGVLGRQHRSARPRRSAR